MRDGSFWPLASDPPAREARPAGVAIADLGYGALYIALDLADARPAYDRLVLLAGTSRGREPGRLYHEQWRAPVVDDAELQARIREAGAGVIDLDHLLLIARHFGGLPEDVVCIELEPVEAVGGDGLSEAAAACLPRALALARAAALAPLDVANERVGGEGP